MKAHERDEDCAGHIVNDQCEACGVWHGAPCDTCGGRGYHRDGCAECDDGGVRIEPAPPTSDFRLSPASSVLFRAGYATTVARLTYQAATVARKYGRPVRLLDGETGAVLHRSEP